MEKLNSLMLAFSLATGASAAQAGVPVDVSDLVAAVEPAVVKITSTVPAGAVDEDGQVNPEEGHGVGSGFIINRDGEDYIVTNNHVVDQASDVKVFLYGQKKPLQGTIVGVDPVSDLAVVKVDSPTPLPHVEFGDSDTMRQGNVVVVIGAPFNNEWSVSSGIISSTHRTTGLSPLSDFLQTDAAMNPGNSGGPMFDARNNKVVGVNSEIFSPTHASVGIGLAAPSNEVQFVVDQLIAHGSIDWGYLGIAMGEVTDEIAQSAGLAETTGVVVANVVPDGPADHAGLKNNDIIMSINGTSVSEMAEMKRLTLSLLSGGTADLVVQRDQTQQHVVVTLGSLPKAPATTPAAAEPVIPRGEVIPGLPGLDGQPAPKMH